jgi:hypothetical protein
MAVVVAIVLFAVAWAVCDQLVGLSVGGSSVAAGVVAFVAFGLTLRVMQPDHGRVRQLRSAQDEPTGQPLWRIDTRLYDVVKPDAQPGERGHALPEDRGKTVRSTPGARDMPARERGGTLVAQDIQFVVDDVGMRVRGKRRTVGGEVWEQRLQVQWSAVRAIGFATSRYDPIVALYAWVAAGRPHHVADSRFLNDLQWTELGELIAGATRGRLILDVASRHNPRSIKPDWLHFSHILPAIQWLSRNLRCDQLILQTAHSRAAMSDDLLTHASGRGTGTGSPS